jgi:hypothetical protein
MPQLEREGDGGDGGLLGFRGSNFYRLICNYDRNCRNLKWVQIKKQAAVPQLGCIPQKSIIRAVYLPTSIIFRNSTTIDIIYKSVKRGLNIKSCMIKSKSHNQGLEDIFANIGHCESVGKYTVTRFLELLNCYRSQQQLPAALEWVPLLGLRVG